MFKTTIFAVAFLLVPAIQLVFAHDAWIEKQDGELVVVYGHGAKHEAYDPENVKAVQGFDDQGKPVAVDIVRHKDKVALAPKGTPAIVTMFYDGGYYVRTTEGGKRMTKREAKGKFEILEGLISQKCSKAFLASTEAYPQALGLRLEIVPEKDPFSVQPGETLPVKVLLAGKPLEGVAVKSSDMGHSNPEGLPRSDKNGNVSVVIAKPGFQLLVTSHKTPIKDDPDADVISLSSSLTFEAR